jgi:hypothetical protein
VSDIDTAVVDSLKALDPEWPIREADISPDYSIKSSGVICSVSGTAMPERLRSLEIDAKIEFRGLPYRKIGLAPDPPASQLKSASAGWLVRHGILVEHRTGGTAP